MTGGDLLHDELQMCSRPVAGGPLSVDTNHDSLSGIRKHAYIGRRALFRHQAARLKFKTSDPVLGHSVPRPPAIVLIVGFCFVLLLVQVRPMCTTLARRGC